MYADIPSPPSSPQPQQQLVEEEVERPEPVVEEEMERPEPVEVSDKSSPFEKENAVQRPIKRTPPRNSPGNNKSPGLSHSPGGWARRRVAWRPWRCFACWPWRIAWWCWFAVQAF